MQTTLTTVFLQNMDIFYTFFPHYRHREYKCFTFNTGQPSKNTVLSSESIFTWTESYCSCIPQCIAPYNAGNSIAYRNKISLRTEYVNMVPKWSASQKITVRHRLSECLMYSKTQPKGAGGPRSIRGQWSTELGVRLNQKECN